MLNFDNLRSISYEMKIILLKDIKNFGKAHDIKNASIGYAKNYLFPQNLAILASEQALKILSEKKKNEEKRKEEIRTMMRAMAEKLKNVVLEISEKSTDEGNLFGSIEGQKIAELLKEKKFDIKKEQILLQSPIKKIGEYSVKLNLEEGIISEVKLIVSKK